jgi:1,5-anhydro-D-fructose reductase (1,5-anhydro-D-mannitol-forming)
MRDVRWGMIGCGEVAEIKSGPAFYKARHSRLVAVMRRNGALAEDFARRHGVARWHTDADAIIEADDIDAIYIATHPDSHLDYTLRCAAAGKAIYVEKPMALQLSDAVAMIEACEAAGVPLWVAYYRRKLERFVAVKNLLSDGAIGIPQAVVIRHLVSAPQGSTSSASMAWRRDVARGGGQFVEGACHTLDLLDFYFGAVEEVRAFVDNRAGAFASEDVVAASFRLATGVLGTGIWCYAAGREDESCEIVGSAGSLRFSVTRASPIELARRHASELIPVGDPEHVQQPLIQSIVDEMNGVGRCPSTGHSALRTAHALDAVMRNFWARQQPG